MIAIISGNNMSESLNVKDMKLYAQANSIVADLVAMGFTEESEIDLEALCKIDQLHYHGVVSVQRAIDSMNIADCDKILEIGAGWGGPSRYIAAQTGAQLTALELQRDFNNVGESLTQRCGLSSLVSHQVGDFLTAEFEVSKFSHIVSWLALYHIPDRAFYTNKIYGLLQPGGTVYVEDLMQGTAYKNTDPAVLSKELFANSLVDESAYLDSLRAVGFEITSAKNMTSDWAAFTVDRLQTFLQNRAGFIEVHGAALFEEKKHFYTKIVDYFSTSSIAGLRVAARKPG